MKDRINKDVHAKVYEALSRFTVMYGITFGRMKMTLSDLDGALIDIRYQDVVQIIKTIPYVGIVLRTGYLYVFMQTKDKPIVINLHTVNSDRLFHDTITPEWIMENISQELDVILQPHEDSEE